MRENSILLYNCELVPGVCEMCVRDARPQFQTQVADFWHGPHEGWEKVMVYLRSASVTSEVKRGHTSFRGAKTHG